MSLLPPTFTALEPFAEQWALPAAAERADMRGSSSAEARGAFHAAMSPRAADALAALDAKPLSAHDAGEQRLMDLLLSFAHVSLAVEVQGEAEARHAPWRARMIITAAPADRAA